MIINVNTETLGTLKAHLGDFDEDGYWQRTHGCYLIPTHNRGAVDERVEKTAKRAVKLGLPAPTVELLADIRHSWTTAPKGVTVNHHRDYQLLQLRGEAPTVPGYAFIGTVCHEHSETLLKAIPGVELPRALRERAGDCDHCHKSRQRKNTYVLRHDDGRILVVGSNCLADFLGGHDPAAALSWLECLDALARDLGDGAGEFYGERCDHFDLLYLLPMVAACIRRHGWVSRTRERESYDGEVATVGEAWAQLDPKRRERMRAEDRVTVEAEDVTEAAAAIDWAAAQDSDSEYERSIRIIATDGWAKNREDGFAASIVAAYQRAQERLRDAERRARLPASRHFGVPRKRAEYVLEAQEHRVIEGDYGTTHIYTFVVDGTGDRAVWFASREQDIERGQTYRIKATVKKHDDHEKYGKRTVLTRCAVLACVRAD